MLGTYTDSPKSDCPGGATCRGGVRSILGHLGAWATLSPPLPTMTQQEAVDQLELLNDEMQSCLKELAAANAALRAELAELKRFRT